MHDQILIIDFGSQYTQLIARRIRDFNVYCEIHPFNDIPELKSNIKGVILSGSPYSVLDDHSPSIKVEDFSRSVPVLGICYGAQMIINNSNGIVDKSDKREYGRATISILGKDSIFNSISVESNVWMSHGDSIKKTPEHIEVLAKTSSIPVAAFKVTGHEFPVYGFQFHPEVTHTKDGKKMVSNFLFSICNCSLTFGVISNK